jgi:hypothetical protein
MFVQLVIEKILNGKSLVEDVGTLLDRMTVNKMPKANGMKPLKQD